MDILVQSTQQFMNKYLNAGLKDDGVAGPLTSDALKDCYVKLVNKLRADGLDVSVEGAILFAVRTDDALTDIYEDWMGCITSNGFFRVWNCTTTPGLWWVMNPVTVGGVTGTAVLEPGVYKKTWRFVTNKNWLLLWLKTPYFQQVKPVTVYRDGNKNKLIDKLVKMIGLYGINIHTGGLQSLIDRWSAGCQVTLRVVWLRVLVVFGGVFVNGQDYSYRLWDKDFKL